jgi:hypothetical protein
VASIYLLAIAVAAQTKKQASASGRGLRREDPRPDEKEGATALTAPMSEPFSLAVRTDGVHKAYNPVPNKVLVTRTRV